MKGNIITKQNFFRCTKLFVTDLTGHFFGNKLCYSQTSKMKKK